MRKEIYIRPTEAEKQEYLAYKSEKDFFANLESGIENLENWQISEDSRKTILIAGAMVVFDKGTIRFINELAKRDSKNRYVLLSEVTAEFRRKTDMCIEFEHICTPHLLAKEIIVPYFDVTLTDTMIEYVEKREYLKEAIQNLEARHINMGRNYALALMYYADIYLSKLIQKTKPCLVILWNEFYAFHSVLKAICEKYGISIQYIEFGCIPGTIALEEGGQQGESYPARHPFRFNRLSICEEEIEYAKQVAIFIKKEQLNRNIQPIWGNAKESLLKRKTNGPVITYMGQNDYESGMYPYTEKAKKYHSPIFESTLKGLEYLSMLSIKNGWNLIYKPHPIVKIMESEQKELEHIECLKVSDINIHELIDFSDVVVTILSQAAYVALFGEKPVVLLGYMQLHRSGAVYEALKIGDVEKKIKKAICNNYTSKQRKHFYEHIARTLKYYLYDDMNERQIRYGKKLEIL